MTEFFIKRFIKNKDDVNDAKVRASYLSLASGVGILLNLLLFAGKLTLGLLATSVAMIADAFNNVSDAGSSLIALIGFRLAAKPVDKKHPLGHGRLEYVSGFIVDMLIVLVGFELLKTSIHKIISPALPTVSTATLFFLGAAILIKIWLFFFYRKIGKRIRSSALKASAFDSLSDCVATALVLLSAIIAKFFFVAIDGWAGILVAAFILFTGIKAAKETIDLLLGSTPDPEFIKNVYAFTQNKSKYPRIVGIHDVMVHDYGPGRQILSFHAEVPSDSDINIAHEEVDQLERDLNEKFGCIVTVHLDPIVVNDPLVLKLKTLAENAAKEVDSTFTIHDFRMTKGETRINLIFDLLMPTESALSTQEAQEAVAEKIRQTNPDCFCVIRAEHPFI